MPNISRRYLEKEYNVRIKHYKNFDDRIIGDGWSPDVRCEYEAYEYDKRIGLNNYIGSGETLEDLEVDIIDNLMDRIDVRNWESKSFDEYTDDDWWDFQLEH